MDILILHCGYFGIDETSDTISTRLNWDETVKEKFRNKLVKYLEDKVQNWRKMTGVGFILQEDNDEEVCNSFYESNKSKLK